MARKARVQFPGATYHVMCRGNHQESVFKDDRDCEVFLDTLTEVARRTGWLIHAFVLMGNHYHLLVETPEANLVDGMRWLQSTRIRVSPCIVSFPLLTLQRACHGSAS